MTGGEVSRRKADHIRLATSDEHQSSSEPGWAELQLVHDALPTRSAHEIDVGAQLLGRELRLPIVIAGMTGGHPDARRINTALAQLAEGEGIAMGVGSQRAALVDPSLVETYACARDAAPNALLIANIGISQLTDGGGQSAFDAATVRAAVDMIQADALVIHLNYLEESIQPEGQTNADGAIEAIARAVEWVDVPVIVKETGAGISRDVAMRVRDVGAAAVDVGGLGGTSFASIEAARAIEAGDAERARLGSTFAAWGIPTAVCVAGCAGVLPVIATGGVRNGLDAAKAIALGAGVVGIGRPLLQAALEGGDATARWIAGFERELRTATFLTGGASIKDLRRVPRVAVGNLAAWLEALGYSVVPEGGTA